MQVKVPQFLTQVENLILVVLGSAIGVFSALNPHLLPPSEAAILLTAKGFLLKADSIVKTAKGYNATVGTVVADAAKVVNEPGTVAQDVVQAAQAASVVNS